ncbi:AAA family ATPase [Apiospora phragmitis]|uniref:AAA family ATPase n=1 Tax=Apiospora phragmitis TaxID=2905665 RepID=A0ABR1TB28_9PEZI
MTIATSGSPPAPTPYFLHQSSLMAPANRVIEAENPSENVEYTISQDRVAGQHAQEESDYKLLEAPSRLGELAASHNRESKLQIQLLEEQNKMRLEMARREQEEFAERRADQLDRKGPGLESDEDRVSDEHRDGDEDDKSDEGSENERSGQDGQNTILAIKRLRKPSKSPPLKRFKETPNEPADEESTAHNVSNENQRNDYRYHVLNSVFCSDRFAKCHLRIYQDEPRQKALRGVHHLAGNLPVADLDEFLRSSVKTAFVVFRDFSCATGSRASLVEAKGQSRMRFSRQLVSIGSADLHDTIQRISKFAPDKDAYRGSPLVLAYVLRRFPQEGSQLELSVWNWGYDGHRLLRKDKTLTLSPPEYGEMRINHLAVYPLRYATQETSLMLLENGKRFCAFSKPQPLSYEGPDYLGDHRCPIESRFMLDYQVYSEFHAHSEISAELSDAHTILLPPGIHGFFLKKEKKWVHLLVDLIRPTNWNKGSFDRLVLPGEPKNLIKGLVIVHKRKVDKASMQIQKKTKQDDIIAGKGSGLIMLLHGGPGTGKTLTAGKSSKISSQVSMHSPLLNYKANYVAELAEIPLYSVTCGDIGTNPEAVEKYLNTVMHLGRKWNCGSAPAGRGRRVPGGAVPIRPGPQQPRLRLPPHAGSRIQLALHYRPLDGPSRRKIWHNFLHMMRENQKIEEDDDDDDDDGEQQQQADDAVDFDDIVAHMDELAAYEMNGRQIRNSLATARQLAVFERETLDWDRIKNAIEVAGDFNNYIKEVHGHIDEQWSRDNRFR